VEGKRRAFALVERGGQLLAVCPPRHVHHDGACDAAYMLDELRAKTLPVVVGAD
jgi:hypothetical protein